eukprot:COSAG05_NODE_1677_length_4292_cov_90.326735_3_plen_49_part_00
MTSQHDNLSRGSPRLAEVSVQQDHRGYCGDVVQMAAAVAVARRVVHRG